MRGKEQDLVLNDFETAKKESKPPLMSSQNRTKSKVMFFDQSIEGPSPFLLSQQQNSSESRPNKPKVMTDRM